jgi:hypothetical protein
METFQASDPVAIVMKGPMPGGQAAYDESLPPANQVLHLAYLLRVKTSPFSAEWKRSISTYFG